MSTLMRRGSRPDFGTTFNKMDRLFEEWMRSLPMRRPFGLGWDWPGEDLIRVDEYREGNTEIIRAELPGIDPQKDVEVTVTDGMLRIHAQRRVEEKAEEQGYTRNELHYGSLFRSLPLPEGASESAVSATYKDGMLEIRIAVPPPPPETEPKKISIQTT